MEMTARGLPARSVQMCRVSCVIVDEEAHHLSHYGGRLTNCCDPAFQKRFLYMHRLAK